VSREEIAQRAYERWVSSGHSHGQDQEHWFAAENELRGGREESPADSGEKPSDSSGRP
jgi:hypothetical protein